MDLATALFSLELSLLQAFLRGTLVYWAIFVLFRLGGRRNIGSLGFADIVVLLLVAEAVGDALSGGDGSLTAGVLVAATIIFWSIFIDRLCFFFPLASRMFEPSKLCLIKDGQMDLRNMRREYVTRNELMEQLRLQSIASLEQVKRAYLENNGEISVIKYDDDGGEQTLTYQD